MEQSNNVKRINIPLDAELHKQLKVRVVLDGITLTQFVKDAILEKLERESADK